jgi:hypothetical protein
VIKYEKNDGDDFGVWQEIEPRYVNITEEVFLPKPEDIAAA